MRHKDGITHDDLLDSLAAADVLETFRALPEDSRRRFVEWIDKTNDRVSHWRRIDILVVAMRCAPRLASATTDPVRETSDR